ncbi:hypothetical protein FSP39_001554 [Pinctada imbricata]|uniref:Uncharacterized protein n=1 Tax=Pinctada imbricata TaxID=66713 RepID=A0AA89BUE4_PINIB|nr:hypothetical protein FSP39_001554 [Pinctada imbricata]
MSVVKVANIALGMIFVYTLSLDKHCVTESMELKALYKLLAKHWSVNASDEPLDAKTSTNSNSAKSSQVQQMSVRSEDDSTPQPPWTCERQQTWRDMGRSYYPRYIIDYTCPNTSCWFGHYRCSPVYYTLKLLTNRGNNDSSSPSIPMGPSWRFESVRITSACTCGH